MTNKPLTEQEKRIAEEERKTRVKEETAILDVQAILSTKAGRSFIKYLFDSLGVGECPPEGLLEPYLREQLGLYRVGQSVFNLVSQANPEIAGQIFAQLQREKHVRQTIEA